MPCRDDGYPCDNDSEATARSRDVTFKQMQNKIDKLTRMLCDVLGKRDKGETFFLSTETEKWWEEYKFLDKQRLAMELKVKEEKRLLESAISKLSPDEVAALRKSFGK
jgi:hypothetical protein